jgi:hypothetical protein
MNVGGGTGKGGGDNEIHSRAQRLEGGLDGCPLVG